MHGHTQAPNIAMDIFWKCDVNGGELVFVFFYENNFMYGLAGYPCILNLDSTSHLLQFSAIL